MLHEFVANCPFKFDVINITETSQKSDASFLTNINIDGYDSFFTPSNTSKGGTGIYVKSDYDVFERVDLNVKTDEMESVWIEIKNKNSKNIVCGCIYRHPHHNNMLDFNSYMNKVLCILNKENKEIYVAGDFNTDLLKIDSVSTYQDFYNSITSYGFLPQIINPTRVTESSATVIDNIYLNSFQHNTLSGNLLISISEHFSQFVSVDRKKVDNKKTKMSQRDFVNFDPNRFRDDISIQNWHNDSNNVDVLFNDFYWKLDACVNKHAPLKTLTRKQLQLKAKPWITPMISKLISRRNKIFKRKKRQPSNEEVKRLYNLFRNRINREIKKAKKNYYTIFFDENKNNIKKTWMGIKSIINTKQSSPNVSQISMNGKIITNPVAIYNTFNNFFASVGTSTNKEIPLVPNISPKAFLRNRNQYNLILAHVSNEEILDIINSLENKSMGPASIPLKLLKVIPDLIMIPLCKIINLSFLTGCFPNAIKIAKVVAIHKGGSTQDVNNFRPISLLSIFDKIIEKLMHKRLYEFLVRHDILYENQFGFRKGNSTDSLSDSNN